MIDDKVVSNNGDSEKVLATVISALFAFFDYHPDAWVYATGSTEGRTRLYKMGIVKYLDEISQDLEVFGRIEQNWHAFDKNCAYTAFLARRKNPKFKL